MPPWAGALAVAVLVADVTVVVSMSVTVLVTVAILKSVRLAAPDGSCQYCAYQGESPCKRL